ncbi:SGNH/GDSL hydrolase family protein [Metamycoplasma neophronis]|uniref:SGNH/GDSL hydrolase family protein n=1 Tax=Metamycoplasma neophronis TaxID=872983 RepID=A0ABY2Z4J1_9BACT|nr:SGNH/GDSL hydrolase family protein [Metamycoplasma neophronis]TPR54321.1 SGNH/GDSL hydrolase family protein [Metamycoplasma neophronis]
MKKSNKLKKTLAIMATAASIFGMAATSISCKKVNTEDDTTNDDGFQKAISSGVNYIAIGDDYAAGNNHSNNNFFENYYDSSNQNILGISYASYLANAINLLNDPKTTLKSYENYGISGSTIEQWLHILDSNKYPLTNEMKINVAYNQNMMKLNNSDRFNKQFAAFDSTAFDKIIDKITKANLMTISLGFNDFFNNGKLLDIVLEIIKENNEVASLEKSFATWIETMQKQIEKISIKYDLLVKKIREINPNININLVGYTSPFLRLSAILKNQVNRDYIAEAVTALNNSIKNVAKANKVNYFGFNNEEYIFANPNKFSIDLLDVFPSDNGYKKLAQDMFMKMALPIDEYQKIIQKYDKDSDNDAYRRSLIFETKGTAIKSLILGLSGDNVDSFDKSYQFESIAENASLKESQDRNAFNIDYTGTFKSYFNDGKLLSIEDAIKYFNVFLNNLNLNIEDFANSILLLEEKLKTPENYALFVRLVNTILDTKTINISLNQANYEINKLIAEKSYGVLEAKDVLNVISDKFLNSDTIYNFMAELANSELFNDESFKQPIKNIIKPFVTDIIGLKQHRNLLGIEAATTLESLFSDKKISVSLQALFEKIGNLIVDNPKEYFAKGEKSQFLAKILNNAKTEVQAVIRDGISWIQSNAEILNKLSTFTVDAIMEVYAIPVEYRDDITYYIKTLISNIDDLKYLTDFIEISLKTVIDTKANGNNLLDLKQFVTKLINNIVFDNYSDTKDNHLLFSLLSFEPKNADLVKFNNAKIIFAKYYAKYENILNSENISSLINEEKRNNLLRLFKNIVTNPNNELNATAKNIIITASDYLVDTIFAKNSLLSQILNQMSNYVITQPAINLIKDKNLTDYIGEGDVNKFVSNIVTQLSSSLQSPELLDKIKNVLHDIINNGSNYKFDSVFNFVLSFIKNSNTNGIFAVVGSLSNQLASKSSLILDATKIATGLLNKETGAEITEEDQINIANYLQAVIINLPKTTLYKNFKDSLMNSFENINESEINDFPKLLEYITKSVKAFFNFENNKALLNQILDVALAKNTSNDSTIQFSTLIKALKAILGKEKLVDFIFSKIDLKKIVIDEINKLNVSNFNISDPNNVISNNFDALKTALIQYVDQKWDTLIVTNIKIILSNTLNNEDVLHANNFEELASKALKINKTSLVSIINQVLDDLIINNESNMKNISNILFEILQQKVNNFSVEDGNKRNITTALGKVIALTKESKVIDAVANSFIENLSQYIANNGFNFKKLDIVSLLNLNENLKLLVNNENINNLLSNLSSDETFSLIVTVLYNANTLIDLIVPSEKNATSAEAVNNVDNSNTNPSAENQSLLASVDWKNAIKTVWNKLNVEQRKTILLQIIQVIKSAKSNEKLLKFIASLIKEPISKLNEAIINDVTKNEAGDDKVASYINRLLKVVANEVINDGVLDDLSQTMTLIVDNFSLYESNDWSGFASNILKRLEANKGNILVSDLIKNLLTNETIANEIAKVLISYLGIEAKTQLAPQESQKLSAYITVVLKNAPYTDLYKKLINKLVSELANLKDNITFNELGNEVLNIVKGYFDLSNATLIKDIQDFLLVKQPNGEHAYNNVQAIQIAKILMDKTSFVDFLIDKFNAKQLIINYVKSIKVSESRFNSVTKKDLENIINYTSEFIDERYDDFLLPLIRELVANLFSEKTTENIISIADWISKFIKNNIPLLNQKVNELFNVYLNGTKGEQVKSYIANFLVDLMEQDLVDVQWDEDSKAALKTTINNLITALPTFNLLDQVINNSLISLSNNIAKHGFDYKQYNFDGLINIVEVINTLNYDNILNYVKSLSGTEITSLVTVLLNNINLFSNIIPDENNINEPSSNSSEVSKPSNVIVFSGNITVNINVFFNLFKAGLSILNDQEREKIKDSLPNAINWIKSDKKVRAFVTSALAKYIKPLILKQNPNSIEFADGVVELLTSTLFDNESASNIINSLANSLINLTSEKLNEINDMNSLLKYLIINNKESIKKFAHDTLNTLFSNEKLVKEAINFAIDIINQHFGLSTTNIEQENIVNLLTRVAMKIGDFNVVSAIIDTLLDTLPEIDILNSEGKFDSINVSKQIIEALKKVEYYQYLTTENISDLLATILDKNIDSVILESELMALYNYLSNNIPKITKKTSSNEEVSSGGNENSESNSGETNNDNLASQEENRKIFLANLEKLIYNALQALNGSIKQDNANGKEALINFIYRVVKDQVLKIDWARIDQNILPKERIEWIATKFIDYPEVKKLISSLVNDFFAGEKIKSTNLGDLISKIILKIKDNLKTNITNFILSASKDKEIVGAVVGDIMKYLKLDEATEDDKEFLISLIQELLPEIVKTEYFSRKVLNRSITWVAKYAESFDIQNATKWLQDAIEKIKSGFSMNDVTLIAQFIGSDKIINGTKLVKLINILFGKSNFEDSVVFNGLRNINMAKDPKTRSNMKTLNDMVGSAISSLFNSNKNSNNNDDPDNITPSVDYLALMNTIYKILSEAYYADPNAKNPSFKLRSQSEAWKAVYRFNVAIDWALFEMFGRETLEKNREPGKWYNTSVSLYSGTRAILWELQEGTNIKAIPGVSSKFSGMAYYFKEDDIRRQFTNYLISDRSRWTYYNEANYTPASIIYLIVTSGYNDSEKDLWLSNFKYKVTEDGQPNTITKREYILRTLKEGGYAKFMNLNNVKSVSSWSGLDKVPVDEF